ncbi:TldD/PmbA family protein [Heliobacterium undosum]|uniref:TldD/PmbA family protein n=1 Tax=Heliomicrobium undosum TaxID=121734 RepID=A0A845L0M6_9FIRM|nr:TldD/PmbA family protein [Heliomicrobium undosum]MZP28475.1 TldD/PmbA family protein [Heliomicrobium undosum]
MSQVAMRELARQMVEKAQAKGANQSEAYGLDSKELSIDVSKGIVETMKLAEDRGIGIRVFQGGKMGYSFTSDLSDKALEATVDRALANARWTAEDRFRELPGKAGQYPDVRTYDPAIAGIPVEQKIELAKTIEATAKAVDPRIKIIERSSYADAEYTVTIINSQGVDVAYQGAYCGGYAYLVAEENGESQTGFSLSYGLSFDGIDPQKIGKEAAEKALRMLGAKPVSSRRAPVVFDPYVATQFLGVLAPSLTAEAVQKGKSLFAGKKGQPIASAEVTVIDDGRMEGRILSAPFDGEGVPTSRTVLIDKGTLQGYLHNTYTAAKEGAASTGNGSRGSFRGTPEVGTTNFYLQAGDRPPSELIGEIESGFYVTEVMGMHTANPISGDFSVGAAGLLIEQGQLTRPVRGVAIAGNLLDWLGGIDGVGSDLTFFIGKGAPTLRAKEMAISGA